MIGAMVDRARQSDSAKTGEITNLGTFGDS